MSEQAPETAQNSDAGGAGAAIDGEYLPSPANRGRGRPTTYTEAIANLICERLIDGDSLLTICGEDGMPSYSAVMAWLRRHEDFAHNYARAKEIHADRKFEEIQQIADDGRNDWMAIHGDDDAGWRLNGEHVQRSKLRVDTLKWRLGRMAPKKYGDHATLAVTGADGGPIASVNLSVTDPAESARMYQALIAGK